MTDALLTAGQIAQTVGDLARRIDKDYIGRDITAVCVMKGAFIFAADLLRTVTARVTHIEFVEIDSYGADTVSSGILKVLRNVEVNLKGRHVLIIDDVVETGLTLGWLMHEALALGADTVEVAVLLRKPARDRKLRLRYVGHDIPADFVVGYGMDYAQQYRNLPDVIVLPDREEAWAGLPSATTPLTA